MPLLKKLNSRAADTLQTGYGTNSEYSGGRFLNKDGTPNIRLTGISFFKRFSIYNTMLRVSSLKFIAIIVSFYVVTNLLFACLYTLTGVEHLGGVEEGTALHKFWEAFFFSAQTLSTVGYGHIYPIGNTANAIAASESILGLLTFALATGMMYGRFSQPKAFIKYSNNLLFSPYKNGVATMFRLVPYKQNTLSDAEVKATLALKVDENGVRTNKFFNLVFEISKINSLNLSWTVVHVVNEQSPFFNLSKNDLLNYNAEVLVYVKAYDEAFSNFVISRTSYEAAEFVFGARFKLMYHPTVNRQHTTIEIDKLNDFERVKLPELEYDLGVQ